jgi:hypothetical protein
MHLNDFGWFLSFWVFYMSYFSSTVLNGF